MRPERTKLQQLGRKVAAQTAVGRPIASIALGLGISRMRIYRALYAVYPAGDWPGRVNALEQWVDPLLR